METENGGFVVTNENSASKKKFKISSKEYNGGVRYFINSLINAKLLKTTDEIDGAGIRIVAPGDYFIETRKIDSTFIKRLENAQSIAPLHISAALDEIRTFKKILPKTPMISVSDSTFHASMPEQSRLYAILPKVANRYEIRRFGYHGISVQSVIHTIQEIIGHLPPKIIVCHLGSGVSITAVKNGKCLDTSMGLTPLEGLPMRSRVGDIDPGAVIYLAKKLRLSIEKLEYYLNNKCGLLALAGQTRGGVRELIELEKNGNKNAKLALEIFSYRIKKYIGAYIAALGGLDILIFTAAIGERSSFMRSLICDDLKYFGIALDQQKNNQIIEANGFIEGKDSCVKVAVIKTDELRMIAREIAGHI